MLARRISRRVRRDASPPGEMRAPELLRSSASRLPVGDGVKPSRHVRSFQEVGPLHVRKQFAKRFRLDRPEHLNIG